MSSPPDNVGKGIVFSSCSIRLVRSFVWSDLVPTISHERLEQSRWNFYGIFNSPYRWPAYILEVRGQRSRWQQAVEVAKASTLTLGV